MITVYPVLRQRMKEHGVSAKELSAATGIPKVAFYLKMMGIMQWKLTDAVNICCFFSIPDTEHLFVRKHCKR